MHFRLVIWSMLSFITILPMFLMIFPCQQPELHALANHWPHFEEPDTSRIKENKCNSLRSLSLIQYNLLLCNQFWFHQFWPKKWAIKMITNIWSIQNTGYRPHSWFMLKLSFRIGSKNKMKVYNIFLISSNRFKLIEKSWFEAIFESKEFQKAF